MEPKWDKIGQFVAIYMHSALKADSEDASHPVRMPIHHPKDSDSLNPDIYYRKGLLLILSK